MDDKTQTVDVEAVACHIYGKNMQANGYKISFDRAKITVPGSTAVIHAPSPAASALNRQCLLPVGIAYDAASSLLAAVCSVSHVIRPIRPRIAPPLIAPPACSVRSLSTPQAMIASCTKAFEYTADNKESLRRSVAQLYRVDIVEEFRTAYIQVSGPGMYQDTDTSSCSRTLLDATEYPTRMVHGEFRAVYLHVFQCLETIAAQSSFNFCLRLRARGGRSLNLHFGDAICKTPARGDKTNSTRGEKRRGALIHAQDAAVLKTVWTPNNGPVIMMLQRRAWLVDHGYIRSDAQKAHDELVKLMQDKCTHFSDPHLLSNALIVVVICNEYNARTAPYDVWPDACLRAYLREHSLSEDTLSTSRPGLLQETTGRAEALFGHVKAVINGGVKAAEARFGKVLDVLTGSAEHARGRTGEWMQEGGQKLKDAGAKVPKTEL
ncbi:predicted protein [Postia placenta Mad-698-R]|uniref:Uncharacterized protein n=1 Tax=Postia placenta MAD-698-R-SB12 TaxID=670580 RepID=A0A1X6MK13_9APHY|nr:hypothetical protein POSPLADRAFT_1037411 [Postia placenta MAD-698-R-SB12]EED83604.1 predicted protein [Postia placenta Mad-698-R]OSX56720.1 hypothetical protein POSPLADRAFT_1037411 [Postia placenta MAD-698-R-SB12]